MMIIKGISLLLHLFILKYRHYLQHHPHTPPPLGPGRSVGPAAGLGGPPLARGAVSVHVAVLTLVQSAVQNVLNVLYYQVDGHCRGQEPVRQDPPQVTPLHTVSRNSNSQVLADWSLIGADCIMNSLTKVVCTARNNHICILFCLEEDKEGCRQGQLLCLLIS